MQSLQEAGNIFSLIQKAKSLRVCDVADYILAGLVQGPFISQSNDCIT